MKQLTKLEQRIRRYYKDLQRAARKGIRPLQVSDDFNREQVFARISDKIDQAATPVRLHRRPWLMAAALAGLCAVSLWIYWNRAMIVNWVSPVEIVQKITPRGKISELTLADGTKVWMNAESQLSYPSVFRGNTREITLEGEAYFEVAPNSSQPFIIHTGKMSTQVIGTSFNINAYKENATITVAVLTGKVKLSAAATDNPAAPAFVTPNQQAVFSKKDERITVNQNVDVQSSLAWKSGRLLYRNTALLEVVLQLQRKYNVSIRLDAAIEHCPITADFSTETLDDVLQVLAEIVNGKITKQGEVYVLKGKGC